MYFGEPGEQPAGLSGSQKLKADNVASPLRSTSASAQLGSVAIVWPETAPSMTASRLDLLAAERQVDSMLAQMRQALQDTDNLQ
jgi:hypothetical protein